MLVRWSQGGVPDTGHPDPYFRKKSQTTKTRPMQKGFRAEDYGNR